MKIHVDGMSAEGQAAAVELEEDESVCVLHPRQIIAFQGHSVSREDRLLSLSGMYSKKKWIESRLSGPARFVLGVPVGYSFKALELPDDSNLLFDIKHVLMYSQGMQLQSRLQKIKQALVTRDWIRMKFSGGGTIGLLSCGPLCELTIDQDRPVYVDIGCLVAFPEDAKLQLCVYGNPLASQRMNYHWEVTGRGKILLQPARPERGMMDPLQGDSLLRRLLRELLPFGNVMIK
ncbi:MULTISPECIES: AIM24 family protein [unclassified Paenibacillus]|uniref:AIM24 family protein n=1 Tax=unclassified Paenibacillus TaxID=185978 RepID=UPI001AE800E0|nr:MULTISPECIES: AIM24 family protein [unclassified Paenibacillus]MBP1156912.1 uncharacterized protein (AIM24 family) [Paenibacillus sp. PvP091]MBP1172349.1 uncharacterized protein (AIM24 family) [Paenibacillus sp. PvR098]MBP2438730.1 uncharacterized protein (AIM24 family) [Paenibacillus sp. PvP052]